MKLARVNTLLLIAIILINGYVITLPLMPGLFFWWQTKDGKQTTKLEQKVQALSAGKNTSDSLEPKENRLIVPSMVFDQPVFEGKTVHTLNNGLWHRPQSSTPDKGGNTVLVGHRLTYTNPKGTLYHLDKVRTGDKLAVWWNGKAYTYTVTETKVVKANQTDIENPTTDPRLTIYTCTPLWLPKDRLVVIAKLGEKP